MNDGILSVIILFYLNIGGFLFICEGKPFFGGVTSGILWISCKIEKEQM